MSVNIKNKIMTVIIYIFFKNKEIGCYLKVKNTTKVLHMQLHVNEILLAAVIYLKSCFHSTVNHLLLL